MGPPRFEGGPDKGQVVSEFEVGREPQVAVRRLGQSEDCTGRAPGYTCTGTKDLQDCEHFEKYPGPEVSSCRGLFP